MNLAQAQQVYFRGHAARLAADRPPLSRPADRRRGVRRRPDAGRGRSARRGRRRPRAAADDRSEASTTSLGPTPPSRSATIHRAAAGARARSTTASRSLAISSSLKRDKEKSWDEEDRADRPCGSSRCSKGPWRSNAGSTACGSLRQPHLAKFINFLQFEVYKHYGKSGADETRSIAQLVKIAAAKPAELRGVEAPTLNRHLTFLNQLLDYARRPGRARSTRI